jgi:hypothetical protein
MQDHAGLIFRMARGRAHSYQSHQRSRQLHRGGVLGGPAQLMRDAVQLFT